MPQDQKTSAAIKTVTRVEVTPGEVLRIKESEDGRLAITNQLATPLKVPSKGSRGARIEPFTKEFDPAKNNLLIVGKGTQKNFNIAIIIPPALADKGIVINSLKEDNITIAYPQAQPEKAAAVTVPPSADTKSAAKSETKTTPTPASANVLQDKEAADAKALASRALTFVEVTKRDPAKSKKGGDREGHASFLLGMYRNAAVANAMTDLHTQLRKNMDDIERTATAVKEADKVTPAQKRSFDAALGDTIKTLDTIATTLAKKEKELGTTIVGEDVARGLIKKMQDQGLDPNQKQPEQSKGKTGYLGVKPGDLIAYGVDLKHFSTGVVPEGSPLANKGMKAPSADGKKI